MINKELNLHLISDSTGETVSTVCKAARAHFDGLELQEHHWALVRSEKQIDRILKVIKQHPGLVIYTLIDGKLRNYLLGGCRNIGVTSLPILDQVVGAILREFKAEIKLTSPGKQHNLDEQYFSRIEAMHYALSHDDGQGADTGLNDADVILVGVSRTSKTPTAMYLANRGIRVANVPIIHGQKIPDSLEKSKALVVGLFTSLSRLEAIRKSRLDSLNEENYTNYVDPEKLKEEILEARKLCAKNMWPTLDVSRKSIEEIAAAVIEIQRKHRKDI